jgi:hypothetical protein
MWDWQDGMGQLDMNLETGFMPRLWFGRPRMATDQLAADYFS